MNLSLVTKCISFLPVIRLGRMLMCDSSAVAVDSSVTAVSTHTPVRVVPGSYRVCCRLKRALVQAGGVQVCKHQWRVWKYGLGDRAEKTKVMLQ